MLFSPPLSLSLHLPSPLFWTHAFLLQLGFRVPLNSPPWQLQFILLIVESYKIQWPFNDYSFFDPGRTQQQVLKEIDQGQKVLPPTFISDQKDLDHRKGN